MSVSSNRYRFRLATSLPARFASWFPNLTAHRDDDDVTVLEGPVADSCQLAGIISAICHRNGEILSVERMENNSDERH